jgi:hypothetical protein
MTTAIKRRRGTTSEHSTFTGLAGEITIDTTKDTVVVHDGSTAGGFPLAKENNPTFTGTATFTGDVSFGDNDKAIFGAGSDLQIYHDGSQSYIKDAGTGDLILRADNLRLQSASGENYLYALSNGTTMLYNNNAQKLATTSTGIDVAGTILADGLTVGGTGRVGIGTTSPSSFQSYANNLVVGTGDGGEGITVYSGHLDYGALVFADGNGSNSQLRPGQVVYDHGTNSMFFDTNGSERMRITSAGLVGIGTTSPDSLVHLAASTGAKITLESTDVAIAANEVIGEIDFYSNDASGIGAASRGSISLIAQDAAGAGSMLFKTSNASTASTERMRIDSSGNVLVGKTSSSFTTEGAEFREDGRLGVTSVSDIAAYFNRTSTDGDIVRFIKFNTTVGSIGTQGGAATIGNGVTGLRFSTAGYVHPHNITTNTASDNTTDLGASTARFKDLRLGGTAYASSAVIEGSSGLGNLEATLQVRSTETMAAGTGGTISLMGDDGTGTQRTFGMIKGAKGDASSGAFGGGLEFYTRTNGIGDAVKSMVIDQYGLVGIGTSSPSVALEVNSASFQMMKLRRGTSGTSAGIITFEQGNGNAVGHIGGAGDNGGLQFRTGFGTGTERMRIDSAGNLMVGKTSATVANDGFTASSAGYVTITDSSFQPLILNRKTSDGTILELRKNNATVGSIGVEGGDNFYITDNNNTGLNMKSGLIIPCNTNGSTRDNAIDLGASSGRFKDLYLGGGVYLGGTTAANHLDDYEEGTWTPTVSLGTISVIRAVYTKIGRAVTVTATILRTTASSSTDTLQITGLPFQGSINGEWLGAAMNNGSNLQSTGIVSYMYGPSDPDRILIYSNRDNASPLSMKHNEFGLNNYLYFTITYFT